MHSKLQKLIDIYAF